MATFVRSRQTGQLQRVGFRARAGGGFERTIGGSSSTEKGGLARERIGRERQAQRIEQERQKQEYETATATREEAVASTVDAEGRPSVIKQTYGPASSRTGPNDFIIGSTSWNVPIAGAKRVSAQQKSTIIGEVQPSNPNTEQRLEAFSARQATIVDTNRGINTGRALGASALSFGSGVAISGFRTATFAKNLVTRPVQTTRQIGSSVVSFARNPIDNTRRGFLNIGSSIRSNPARFAGVATADVFTGVGVDRGFRTGTRAFRFAGKTEVPASEIVAPTYLSGTEVYPTGTPRSSVSLARREQRVFSAMPEAPNKGRSFTVLTQEEKVAKGLDLSETGGLYTAPRVSPIFTQVVTKGPSGSTFSIIPRFGAPGAVAEISTDASRLPLGVRRDIKRTNSISPGNTFLDQGGAIKAGGARAYSTPATELGIKAEAELIIPGGSSVQRVNDYGFFSRAVGRDFDYFVRIPKTPGSKETVPVAFRQYKNLGFGDDVVSRARGKTVSSPSRARVSRVSDIDYYSSPRASSAGILSYAGSLGRLARSSGSSVARSSSISSNFSSGGLFRSYLSGSYSYNPYSSSYGFSSRSSGSSRSSSSSSSNTSSSSLSFSASSYSSLPPGFKPPFIPPLDEGKRRKKNKRFEQTKQKSIFSSSLTAGILRLRGDNRGRQSSGFTGIELRGI